MKEMVESAPWAIIKSTSIYNVVWQSEVNEEYWFTRKRKTWRVGGEMVGKWASGNVKGETPQWTNIWWVLSKFKGRLSSIGKDLQIVPHSRRWSCTRFDSHARVESYTIWISKVQFTYKFDFQKFNSHCASCFQNRRESLHAVWNQACPWRKCQFSSLDG